MKNNENILNSKYKITFIINDFINSSNINAFLEFSKNCIMLKFIKKKLLEENIQNLLAILYPLYNETEKDNILYIPYYLIQKILLDEKNQINLIIVNPIFRRKVSLVLNIIEKCNFFLCSKLNDNQITFLLINVNKFIKNEKNSMIDKIYYFSKNFLEVSNPKNIEMIFKYNDNCLLIKAISEGKKYYENSTKQLIKHEKFKYDFLKNINLNIINNLTNHVYEYASYENILPDIKKHLNWNLFEILIIFNEINLIDKNSIYNKYGYETMDFDKYSEGINLEKIEFLVNNKNNPDFFNNEIFNYDKYIFFGTARKNHEISNKFMNSKEIKIENVINTTPRRDILFNKLDIKYNLFEESNFDKELRNGSYRIKFHSSIIKKNSNFESEKEKTSRNNINNELFQTLKQNHNSKKTPNYEFNENREMREPIIKENLNVIETIADINEINCNNKDNNLNVDKNIISEKEMINEISRKDIKFSEKNEIAILKNLTYRDYLDKDRSKRSQNKEEIDELKFNNVFFFEEDFKKNTQVPNNVISEKNNLYNKYKNPKTKSIFDKINELKNKHLFSTNSTIYEIFNNTIEVIIRKYFEYCFEEFFEKAFIYQKDNNGFLKLDSLISFLFYIRGLKYLVMPENLQQDYIEFLQLQIQKIKDEVK